MTARDPAVLFAAARDGDRPALARLLSIVESGGDAARDVARLVAGAPAGEQVHPKTDPKTDTPAGHHADMAYTVGITGAPGSGKSTLSSALVTQLRSDGQRVAVLAIDPTSPYSGGAILGDRVRMQDHATDDGVFIRSMATRGHLGGLSLATPAAVRLFEAVGHRLVLIETVGVGQVEVEVAAKADSTVVVVNPGWGDSVQANKAGLMEVADVFLVNKADRAGADETARDLAQMLELAADDRDGWRPPIVKTVATDGSGVAEAWEAVCAHRAHAAASGELTRRRSSRATAELREIVAARLEARARDLCGAERWGALTAGVADRSVDPWTAADELLG